MPEEQFHDGLIAAWWSQAEGGPEIDYYRRTIERSGEPVLDAGCGSGRLLIPYLQAGIDIDGSDRSSGMIRVCRDRFEAGGLTTQLYTQANHELDLPRRYRTIIVVGTFGIGTTRREDASALERLKAHLLPGGTLAIDIELPWTDSRLWRAWARPPEGPRRWRQPMERAMPDGSVIQLRTRLRSFDPLDQVMTSEVRVSLLHDGTAVREERRPVRVPSYLPGELLLMLERAGFRDVRVTGDYTENPPNAHSEFLVFEGVA
jgi:SAM-dependent methyltransferase